MRLATLLAVAASSLAGEAAWASPQEATPASEVRPASLTQPDLRTFVWREIK